MHNEMARTVRAQLEVQHAAEKVSARLTDTLPPFRVDDGDEDAAVACALERAQRQVSSGRGP